VPYDCCAGIARSYLSIFRLASSWIRASAAFPASLLKRWACACAFCSSVSRRMSGGLFGPSAGNRLDMLARFAENKAAPLVTFATGLLRGTAREGQPFNVPEEIGKRFVPLVMQDAWQAMKEWGPEGIGVAAPALFGVGVQTYE